MRRRARGAPLRHEAEGARRVAAVLSVRKLIGAGDPRLVTYGAVASTHGVSPSTIRNWYRLVRTRPVGEWWEILTPEWRGRTKTIDPEIDQSVWSAFFEMWYCDPNYPDGVRQDRLPITMIHRVLRRWCVAAGLRCPSRSTLERRVDSLLREWGGRSDPRPMAPRRSWKAAEAAFLARLGLV